MIHFTPLQERGESDSPYSIYDQLKWDPKIFPDQKKAVEQIHKVLNENGLLSLTDVVWNHTANNSEWLKDAPDSGYNEYTAPHLIPAIELDGALLEFSKKLAELNLPTTIENESDLGKVMEGIKSQVLDSLNLWEYYVFNREKTLSDLEEIFNKQKSSINSIKIPDNVDINNLKQLSQFVLDIANIHSKTILGHRFEK